MIVYNLKCLVKKKIQFFVQKIAANILRQLTLIWREELFVRDDFKGSRVCLFAAYCPRGKVRDGTMKAVQTYVDCGFDIIFVFTGKKLCSVDFFALKDTVSAIIYRPNLGFDFGSWLVGWQYLGDLQMTNDLEFVLLTNDSVFIDPVRTASAVENAKHSEHNFVAMALSNEIRPHYCSFWWFFNVKLIETSVMTKFFERLVIGLSKGIAITFNEVRILDFLIEESLSHRSFYEFEKIRGSLKRQPMEAIDASDQLRVNPSLSHPSSLVEIFEYPFIKREVVEEKRWRYSTAVKLNKMLQSWL